MGFQQEAKRSHLVRPPAVLDGVVRLHSSEFRGSGFRGFEFKGLRKTKRKIQNICLTLPTWPEGMGEKLDPRGKRYVLPRYIMV